MSTAKDLERIKEWNRNHPEARSVINKKYREKHLEKIKEQQRLWYQRKKQGKLAAQQSSVTVN